jgi:hypothetical protein
MTHFHHTTDDTAVGAGLSAGMMMGIVLGMVLLIAIVFAVIARPWGGSGTRYNDGNGNRNGNPPVATQPSGDPEQR